MKFGMLMLWVTDRPLKLMAKESEDAQKARLFADFVNVDTRIFWGFGTCVRLVECVNSCAQQTFMNFAADL
jgi:hypothetical protein